MAKRRKENMPKKKQAKKFKVGTMTVTCNLPATTNIPPAEEKDLATLEKELDLASVRFTYAIQQGLYWQAEQHKRSQEFNFANLRYRQKKHGFTDEEIEKTPPKSSAVWTYAE